MADGQLVVIETARGRIEALAWVYPGIGPDTDFIPIGWGERQPFNHWPTVNWLTGPAATRPPNRRT